MKLYEITVPGYMDTPVAVPAQGPRHAASQWFRSYYLQSRFHQGDRLLLWTARDEEAGGSAYTVLRIATAAVPGEPVREVWVWVREYSSSEYTVYPQPDGSKIYVIHLQGER